MIGYSIFYMAVVFPIVWFYSLGFLNPGLTFAGLTVGFLIILGAGLNPVGICFGIGGACTVFIFENVML